MCVRVNAATAAMLRRRRVLGAPGCESLLVPADYGQHAGTTRCSSAWPSGQTAQRPSRASVARTCRPLELGPSAAWLGGEAPRADLTMLTCDVGAHYRAPRCSGGADPGRGSNRCCCYTRQPAHRTHVGPVRRPCGRGEPATQRSRRPAPRPGAAAPGGGTGYARPLWRVHQNGCASRSLLSLCAAPAPARTCTEHAPWRPLAHP